jgi:glycosyltransferase involved in cell wall biosynthesis
VKIFVAYRDNAASYYRLVSPFSAIRYRTEHEVYMGSLNLDDVMGYDVLWLQMHADPTAELIVHEFKALGGRVVYDVDDWLFEIPASWPSYDHYYTRGSGKINQRLHFHERLVRAADIVTCTTEYLQEKLRLHFGEDKRVEVLPNCILQGDWDTIIPKAHEMDGPVLGWFGTENHWDDWIEIAGSVERALLETNGYLALIGAPELGTMFSPWLAERTLIHPLVSWNRLGEIRELIAAFDVGLAWCTNRFETNKCRSPLKAIQYGAAGVPVVASTNVYGDPWDDHWREEHSGYVITDFGWLVRTPASLKAALVGALTMDKAEARMMSRAWQQEVWASHSYERRAMKWLDIL